MSSASAKARVADPDGHYPYKLDHVLNLIDQNAPAGPEGPDDDRANLRDFISPAIAQASAAYIEAQARHIGDPNNVEFKSIYETQKAELVEARRRHRANRVSSTVTAVRGAE